MSFNIEVKKKFQNLIYIAIFIYISIAPVYWIPYVNYDLLDNLKNLLAITIILMSLSSAVASGKIFLIPVIFSPIFPIVLLSILTLSLIVNQLDDTSYFLQIGLPFLTLAAAFYASESQETLFKTVTSAGIVIGCFSFITILSFYFPALNIRGPYYDLPLWQTGFGSARTGWSAGISFYASIMIAALSPANRSRSSYKAILYVFSVISIIISQLLCGGRGGFIMSISSFAITIASSRSIKYRSVAILTIFIVSSILISLIDQGGISTRFSTQGNSTYTSSDFSAGRIDGFIIALDVIQQHTLLGKGYGNVDLKIIGGLDYSLIHNLYLKSAAEGGIIYATLIAFFMISTILSPLLSIGRGRYDYFTVLAMMLSVSIMIGSMIEPGIPIGAYHNTAIFWIVFGIYLKESRVK